MPTSAWQLSDHEFAMLKQTPLINADGVFALLRRLFSGSPDYIIGELLQSSDHQFLAL